MCWGKMREKEEEALLNRPKRPKSAYLIFASENRQKIVAEELGGNGNNINAVYKAIVTAWNALSDEAKQPYMETNAKDKERS